jgi:hypothetical protein
MEGLTKADKAWTKAAEEQATADKAWTKAGVEWSAVDEQLALNAVSQSPITAFTALVSDFRLKSFNHQRLHL